MVTAAFTEHADTAAFHREFRAASMRASRIVAFAARWHAETLALYRATAARAEVTAGVSTTTTVAAVAPQALFEPLPLPAPLLGGLFGAWGSGMSSVEACASARYSECSSAGVWSMPARTCVTSTWCRARNAVTRCSALSSLHQPALSQPHPTRTHNDAPRNGPASTHVGHSFRLRSPLAHASGTVTALLLQCRGTYTDVRQAHEGMYIAMAHSRPAAADERG